ncbi:bifunctional 3,4-dihydroxy-2-butanone-4-phosphate synthase/GTP cyclohydrolase II [Nitriliruptor alkaliphilus]|uniref:bifunctional 3,4-dihydroxy-2-butanone-4-phosphate synthase/GTP cyclohydrolase II n=1 Tax=Nitriliruptor alkaliphilus TaxID=427918 RepID=UPI0009FB246C|nr:bifunctional 3,4-dihydroxy-2-butanone-4-phosphate synthase/GTP cyclohydrolase II [Nitriliruptor alkaliphilus]
MRGQVATLGLEELGRGDAAPGGVLDLTDADLAAGLSSIEDALAAIARGELVIVVDDVDRENEGDLVGAAELVTDEHINTMVTVGRGLVCAPMTGARLDALGLGPMVPEAAGREETAFTVSVDLEVPGSTGISAADRARTIRHLVDEATRPEQLRRPGHVFPLRARPGGVLEREGHTEAAVDLARMAGLAPAGVICEIMNPDGTMARMPELLAMAQRRGLHLITIADLVVHRRRHERQVTRVTETVLPTDHGDFRAIGFRADDGQEHLVLARGELGDVPLVRVHSECLTGDVLGSRRCDCGEQLEASLAAIAEDGHGALVYLRGHEGRGIGLVEKLRAYALQETGSDTVEANVELGHAPDAREYHAAAQMLLDLGVDRVRLLTNNPIKGQALTAFGVTVTERVAVEVAPNEHNVDYLTTKQRKMGHELRLVAEGGRP